LSSWGPFGGLFYFDNHFFYVKILIMSPAVAVVADYREENQDENYHTDAA